MHLAHALPFTGRQLAVLPDAWRAESRALTSCIRPDALQFAFQEPGTNEQIKKFAEEHGFKGALAFLFLVGFLSCCRGCAARVVLAAAEALPAAAAACSSTAQRPHLFPRALWGPGMPVGMLQAPEQARNELCSCAVFSPGTGRSPPSPAPPFRGPPGRLMDKIKVNGSDASPVYNFLKVASGDTSPIAWK